MMLKNEWLYDLFVCLTSILLDGSYATTRVAKGRWRGTISRSGRLKMSGWVNYYLTESGAMATGEHHG